MSKFATTASVAKWRWRWTSKSEVWSSNPGECKIIKKTRGLGLGIGSGLAGQ